MATVPLPIVVPENDYPSGDGKPMAETDWHRVLMVALIQTLDAFYAADPLVYVSGNLLMYYVRGDKRRHLSPDVFLVKGVRKGLRANYLTWEEGKCPDLVIELTSSSTRHEDLNRKYQLYQSTLRVTEYFLFDPRDDYLEPRLQGFRLRRGRYVPVRPVRGRLPSGVLGLHLEEHGESLRLYDPATRKWLPTPAEVREQTAAALREEKAARRREAAARRRAEVEAERLRRELEELRRRTGG
jgi:Uma2 family endonuclease